MTNRPFNDRHGQLLDGGTLCIQRQLPGPIERVWAYLTDSELRRQWLASGDMALQPGATFELTWRNDELSASPAERPDGFGAESRATCTLQEVAHRAACATCGPRSARSRSSCSPRATACC